MVCTSALMCQCRWELLFVSLCLLFVCVSISQDLTDGHEFNSLLTNCMMRLVSNDVYAILV